MTTDSEMYRARTPEENFHELYKRTAELSDAVRALLTPAWGSEMGLLPTEHPLYQGEQPGPAATEATKPRADLVLHRDRGTGLTVVEAPARSRIHLDNLTRGDDYLRVHNGVIEIADQVAYRITGYNPDEQTFDLDLVADWRIDTTVRASQLASTLGEVLRQFVHETHPGRRCLQSGHVNVETVDRWRDVLNPAKETPCD